MLYHAPRLPKVSKKSSGNYLKRRQATSVNPIDNAGGYSNESEQGS